MGGESGNLLDTDEGGVEIHNSRGRAARLDDFCRVLAGDARGIFI